MCIKFRANTFRLMLIIFFTMNLAACHWMPGSSKKEAQFASMFPDIKMGEYLKLATVANGEIPPETRNDYINVAIINISDQQIILPPDLPNENYIYNKVKEEWVPIPEKLISDETTITLYPKDDLEKDQFRDWAGPIKPDLSGYTKPIVVRVVIFGEILQNGVPTGQRVGSYIDITFKP